MQNPLSAQETIQAFVKVALDGCADEKQILAQNIFGEECNVFEGLFRLGWVLQLEAKAQFLQRFAGKTVTVEMLEAEIKAVTALLRHEVGQSGENALDVFIHAERAFAYNKLLGEMDFWLTLLIKEIPNAALQNNPAQLIAICEWCQQNTADPATIDCYGNRTVEYPDGTSLPSMPYENQSASGDPDHRCHDCGVKLGQYHHPGCDGERCPRCLGQLISCGCLDQPEEKE